MEQEQTYLISLLRAFIHGTAPEKPEGLSWERLISLAGIHAVTGIVGHMAMKYDLCPEPETRKKLRTVCMQTVNLYTRRAALAQKLTGDLAAEQVPTVAMKGYILRQYYPVPELRTYGDVDLTIRPEDRAKCHQLMLDWGFAPGEDWEPVYSYRRGEEYYELHTRLLDVLPTGDPALADYFADPWQHAVKSPDEGWQFTPRYHFVYLIAHIAKHLRGGGSGLRMYLDIAAFLLSHDSNMNWEEVRQDLEHIGLWPCANGVLTAVSRWFGVESPLPLQAPTVEQWTLFQSFVFLGGVFGQAEPEQQTHSALSRTHRGRAGAVTARLFPSARTIETRYTYLQKRPWLLPVAWVHRLVRTRDRWGQHKKEADSIMHADEEKIEEVRALYRYLGL